MKRALLLSSILLAAATFARAGQNEPSMAQSATSGDAFDGGSFELQLMSGVAGAPIAGNHISYHYTDTELRLGWMLYSPHGSGLFRGNLEILVAAGGGGVFEGPGSVYGTLGGILRYNFVQPSARLVPYFQLGASAFASDISENKREQDIGGMFEADLNAGVGLKFLLGQHWAIGPEIFFEHVSNADTQTHNVGINALGGLLGISHSF